MRFSKSYPLIALTLCGSCNFIDDSKLFSLMPVSHTHITFQNKVGETEEFNVLEYGYLYNGGGVAAGDLNNDGLIDLYFTGNMVGSHLYINKGNLEFEEMAKEAGVFADGLWNTGVTMADVNADGLLDIYVCRSAAKVPSKRENLLFINNGDLTFSEQAKQYGIADSGYSTHASFFDFDNDGDLDLYVLNHSTQEYAGFGQITASLKQRNNPDYADKLYRNDNGKFVEVGKEAGLVSNVLGFGLGLAVSDINNDGWLDIYISNDYNEQDYLYINNQDGTFTESLAKYIGHTSLFSMGSDVADINNDGYTDIVTLDMLPEDNYRQKMVSGPDNYEKFSRLAASGFHHQTMRNMLQLNNGGMSFSEIGQFAGISNTDWSWAPLIADFDNDGFKDIFITNGYKRDYTNMDFMNYAVQQKLEEDKTGTRTSILSLLDKMPATIIENYGYKNNGDATFTKMNTAWGLDQAALSNGAAYADLDNDGDLDLIVNNLDEPAFIYRNNTITGSETNYLHVKLHGPKENPMGVGARIVLHTQNTTQVQEYIPSRGYQSAMALPIHFGMPSSDKLLQLEVFWPNGKYESVLGPKENQLLHVYYKNALPYQAKTRSLPQLFEDRTSDSLLPYRHIKNNHNDFRQERLLPHKLSTQGPRMAQADVNGDGLQDIFIPGGKEVASALFVQQKDGTFKESNKSLFTATTENEVVNAHFFDMDGDGDADLYLVMGGNEFEAGADLYQDQLYTNTGNGNFVLSANALPQMNQSSLAITSADIDGDGDLDLFIGGRLVPGNYPTAPQSVLLENMGNGTFEDATQRLAPELGGIGMVTDAHFEDLNGNGLPDLVVVGEWMPITVFENKKGQLNPITKATGLEHTKGWWNVLKAADFDADGDMDFVVGNLGLNSQLKTSIQEPVSLYYADFDGNGAVDPILTYFIQGEEYPVYSKDDMQEQLVFLKTKYVNYSDYASQQITDILTPEQFQKAERLNVDTFAHLIIENTGNFTFKIKELPKEAQWAPIYAIKSDDINGDNKKDLILGGNFYGCRVKFGRYDTNKGAIYFGDGEGDWEYVSSKESGLNLNAEIRDVKTIQDSSGHGLLIFSQTDGPLLIYKSNLTFESHAP